MARFATAAELASFLQVPEVDTYTAELLLDAASAAIRLTAGQAVDEVTDDTVTLHAPYGPELRLPQRPASEPTVVEVAGETVTDWSFDGVDTLYRPSGWRAYDTVTGAPLRVSVTYTHGYASADVPAELKRICLQAAGRAMVNPSGLRSETIGSESYTYATETAVQSVDLTEQEIKAVRQALGVRSVGSVYLRT